MLVYLCVDGFTSTLQEFMFKGYKTSTNNQMMHINMWAALISILSMPSLRVTINKLFNSLSLPKPTYRIHWIHHKTSRITI